MNLERTMTHGDFDGFQMSVIGVRYVIQQGHTWGEQILSALFFFVPRSIWPDKTLGTGAMLANNEQFSFINLSSPLFLEAYIDFSFMGVIALSALAGALIARAEKLINNQNAPQHYVLASIACISFMPIILRGSLLSVIAPIASIIFYFFMNELLSHLFSVKRRSERSTTS